MPLPPLLALVSGWSWALHADRLGSSPAVRVLPPVPPHRWKTVLRTPRCPHASLRLPSTVLQGPPLSPALACGWTWALFVDRSESSPPTRVLSLGTPYRRTSAICSSGSCRLISTSPSVSATVPCLGLWLVVGLARG